jgi:ribonuclease T1
MQYFSWGKHMNLSWISSVGVARMKSALSIALISLLALLSVPAGAYARHAHHDSVISEVALSTLPAEAKETLRRIKQGGPFSSPRDGVVFGNYEKRLPKAQRGYYHEYTVKTPGARNRGARRIVCGKPAECYYSDDHYQTFKLIRE